MPKGELDQATLDVLSKAGPYPWEAYGFVHSGLGYTVQRIHGEEPQDLGHSGRRMESPSGASNSPESLPAGSASSSRPGGPVSQRRRVAGDEASPGRRHVNGQQLCLGLRDFAIERFGLFAPVVFERWNIHRTDDFGRMVFAMIDARLMSRNSEDSMDDFRGVFDFDEAFSHDALLSGIGVRCAVPEPGLRREH